MTKNIERRKLKKRFKIFTVFSFVLTFFFGIESILSLSIIICDFFSFPIASRILNFISLWKHSFIVEKLQNLQNIYTAFFVGFIAAYFTVLSIFLGRKKELGFKSCIKYMVSQNFLYCHFSILIVNFFLIEFSFSVFQYSPFVELHTEDAILQLLWTFTVAVYNMTYMEEKGKATELLRKYLKNENDFLKCFNDFISRCFPKEKFEIYINSFAHCKKEQKTGLFLSLTKEINNFDEAKAKDYEGLIDVLIKELYRLFSPNHLDEIDFDSVYTLYDMLLSLILDSSYLKDTKKSYILKSREPLYSFIDFRVEKGNIPKKVEFLANKMLDRYKQIIIVSLYHCDIEVVRQEINDFLGMSLPLQVKNFPSAVINKHTKYVMDLITWIFNLLQFKKISVSYLTIIPSILTTFDFSSILIFDIDSEMYDEGVNPGTMHTVIYNRNYYIAMLLLYCEVTKKYSTSQLIKKFKYAGGSRNNTGFEYKNVLGGLRDIIKTDFVSIMPDYNSDFENVKSPVEELLQERIKIAEEKQMTNLRNQINYEKVKEAFLKRKQDLQKEFDLLSDKTSSYVDLRPVRVELSITQREIENDTSLLVFHDNYYSKFFAMLFARYIKSDSLSIKNVRHISEIPFEKGETLFISHKLYAILYKVKGLKFIAPAKIICESKEFIIEFVHENIDFIVLKSDFQKAFSKPCLNDVASKIKEEEISNDILFKTTVDLIFSENMNMEFPVYRIEEFKKENDSNEESK